MGKGQGKGENKGDRETGRERKWAREGEGKWDWKLRGTGRG